MPLDDQLLADLAPAKGSAEDRPPMPVGEAAERLGISKPTLLRLWAQGLLDGYRVTPYRNGRVRFYRDSVELFERQRKAQVPTLPSAT